MISRMLGDSDDGRRRALEDLCLRYWKPMYYYIRTAWPQSNEDAKDVNQAFFLWLAEKNPLRSFDPSKGSFRKYVKVVLWRFVRDRCKSDRARPLSLEEGNLESRLADPEAGRELDREWARQLAREAIHRVRRRLEAAGHETWFRAYEAYDLAGGSPTYAAVAASLALTENQVRKILSAVRRQVRQEILDDLQATVRSREELAEEWNELFGS
jgi:RNA polymerase sigma factor (sigma-70 family)